MPSRVRMRMRSASNSAKVANSHWIGRIIDGRTESELDAFGFELIGDGAGIGNRAGQPVEFGYDKCVTLTHSCNCLIQAGASTIGAGQAMVGVDAIRSDAEIFQRLFLGGEALIIG